MEVYKYFIGIDIGKETFVVNLQGQKDTKEYENTALGIKQFIEENELYLRDGLSVLETTGGYELRLLYSLCEQGYQVHRAMANKVKHFIRSFGNKAKTDKLDAKALALYGAERFMRLECFAPQTKQHLMLFELVQRRQDLKKMLVAEKNRLQAPRSQFIKASCKKTVDFLSEQVKDITAEINTLVDSDPLLHKKKKILKSVPGIGDIVAFELLILMPELGSLNRRKIASLAGLAPRANDSGQFCGYRPVAPGRDGIKQILFLAAMAARNSHSNLKTFYQRLIDAGKKKMVALTALMRKIIIIANARLKEIIP